MRYAIGIDLGTSGVKVGIYDESGNLASGRGVANKTAEYPMYQPQNGYAEQNPTEWWEAVKKALCDAVACIDKPSKICAVGLSGQMHGLVLLDESNEVIRPAILWCDQRTGSQRDYIESAVGAQKLLSITANPAISSFTAAKLLWVRENEPENYRRIRHVLLPKDYIRFMLCGEYATDVSDASGTQLLDIKNRCWSDEVLNLLDIDKALLPKVYESAEITGHLSEDIAKLCGLNAGLPIAGGGGDNACAAVGTGVVRDGLAFTTIGTSGVVFAHTSQMKLDEGGRIHTFCAAVKGEWHMMGVTQAAGLSLKWLRDTLCGEEKEEAHKKGIDSYEYLDMLAKTVPIGADKLIYLPYLMGERTPHLDPNARGVFFGLSAIHEKKHIIRAVLEGISYSLRDCLEIFIKAGADEFSMAICGGGAKSPFLQQMLSDVYGCRITLPSTSEGACLGAAILGFCCAEVFSSVQEACGQIIKTKSEITPKGESSAEYEKYYEVYKSLYPMLRNGYEALTKI